MRIFWSLSLLYPGYLGYEMYTLIFNNPSNLSLTMKVFNLSVAGGTSIFVRIFYISWSWFVAGNFGLGLKEKVLDKRSLKSQLGYMKTTIKSVLHEPILSHGDV